MSQIGGRAVKILEFMRAEQRIEGPNHVRWFSEAQIAKGAKLFWVKSAIEELETAGLIQSRKFGTPKLYLLTEALEEAKGRLPNPPHSYIETIDTDGRKDVTLIDDITHTISVSSPQASVTPSSKTISAPFAGVSVNVNDTITFTVSTDRTREIKLREDQVVLAAEDVAKIWKDETPNRQAARKAMETLAETVEQLHLARKLPENEPD